MVYSDRGVYSCKFVDVSLFTNYAMYDLCEFIWCVCVCFVFFFFIFIFILFFFFFKQKTAYEITV